MQRAAAGLARRCALLLADRGGVYGARVLLLVGSGDNGGDALYAGRAAGPARARRCRRCCSAPDRAHADGLAALRAAGGRRGRPAAGRGRPGARRHRRHRRHAAGCAETADRAGRPAWPALAAGTARGRPWSRSTCPAGSTWTPATCADAPAGRRGARRRDGHLRRLKPAPGGRAGRRARRPGRAGRHRPGPWLRGDAGAAGCPTWPTSPAGGRGPAPSSDKYTRGVVGLATGSATYPGAARALGRRRAGRPDRHGPLRRRRRGRRCCTSTRR